MQSSSFANILSGSLIALVNISVAMSVAALLFAQTDPLLMVPGIAILLIGTLVTGLGGTLFSDLNSVICAPRNGLVPVFAVMVSSIYVSFGSEYSIGVEATIIVAIMVTTLISGLFLLLLGRMKLGNLVRYIPYPVTGGFFAGIGYIFIEGGLTVASGQEPTLGSFSNSGFLQLTIPAVLLALSLIIGKMFRDNRLSVPGILHLSFLIFALMSQGPQERLYIYISPLIFQGCRYHSKIRQANLAPKFPLKLVCIFLVFCFLHEFQGSIRLPARF